MVQERPLLCDFSHLSWNQLPALHGLAGKHTVKDAELIKEEIGYMSQRFGLYPDLSVIENINFYADIYSVPRKGRKEKIEELLEFSNLTPFRKRLAGNLSGGMKQKLDLPVHLFIHPKFSFWMNLQMA